MSWTVIFLGFAACLATALTGYFIHERRQRAAFIATPYARRARKTEGL
jgi:hypothetical protein